MTPLRARKLLEQIEQRIRDNTMAARTCCLTYRWWVAVVAAAFGGGYAVGKWG